MKLKRFLTMACGMMLLACPVVAQAQLIYSSNSDGSLNVVAYLGSGPAVVIPDTTNCEPIVYILPIVFENHELYSVVIGNNVTNIGDQAFQGCRYMTNLVIGNGVTSVGNDVFFNCANLTSVIVGNSITNIGIDMFEMCSSLASFVIPTNVITVGGGAFQDCTSLTNIVIGTNVTSIGENAFGFDTNLVELTIPDSVQSADDIFFLCSGLASVSLGNGLTNIASQMFANCPSLTNVIIGTNVTSIGSLAFGAGSKLVNLTIPSSVTNIGEDAFNECRSLTGIYFCGNAPSVDATVFAGITNATAYYVPGTTGWSNMLGTIPTAVWLPQVQCSEANSSGQSNGFGFNINWASGQTVIVDACTNLFQPNWTPVQTNTLTSGSVYFSDSQWTNYTGRYYRLRSP